MGKTNAIGSWAKNFGSATKYASVNVMTNIAPNTAEIVRSGRDSAYDLRKQMLQTKTSIKTAVDQVDRTSLGNRAKRTFEQAMKDIKSGNFGINKIERDYTDFDIDMPSIPEGETNTEQYELAKFNQDVSNASTMASLEATKASTQAITRATLLSTKALGDQVSNIMMVGLNKINQNQMQANNYLKNIDANLGAMIEFQNQSVSTVNQAMMSYMSETQEAMTAITEYIKETRTPHKGKTRQNDGDNLFKHGLDMYSYKDYIKKNLGSFMPFTPTMIKDMAPLMFESGRRGRAPAQMLLEFGLSMLMPKAFKKGAKRIDNNIPKYIRHSLMKVGSWADDPSQGLMKMLFGSIFGIKTPKLTKIKLGDYKKGATTFDGTTKKAIEEVIPDLISKSNMYLAKLSGMKPSREYFDYDQGIFIDRNEIQKEYTKKIKNTATNSLYGTINDINKEISNMNFGGMDDKQMKHVISEIQKGISKVMINNISGDKKVNLSNRNDINNLLQGVIEKKAINYINQMFGGMDRGKLVDIENAIFDSKVSVTDFMNSIGKGEHGEEGIYRALFNRGQDARKITKNSLKNTNLFDEYDAERAVRDSKITKAQKALRDKSEGVGERVKGAKESWENRRNSSGSIMSRLNNSIEKLTDKLDKGLYDIADGNFESIANSTRSVGNKVRSKASNTVQRVRNIHIPRRRNSGQENTNSQGANTTVTGSVDQYEQQLESNTRNLMNQIKIPNSNTPELSMPTDGSSLQASTEMIVQSTNQMATVVNESNRKTSKAFSGLVYGIYSTFLKPSYDMVFGKDGLIGKYILNDRTKETVVKIKKYLFGEKNVNNNNAYEGGIMSGIANEFADAADYMKYVFTGKGYTNRKGEAYADNEDSVFGYVSRGFAKVGDYFMQYIFGEDYENNENYKKTFGKVKDWWKNRRKSGQVEDNKEEVIDTSEAKIENLNSENINNQMKLQTRVEKNRLKRPAQYNRNSALRVKSASRKLKTKSNSNTLESSLDGEAASEDAPSIILNAAVKTANEIEKIGPRVSEITLGEVSTQPVEKSKKKIASKFKSKLPKIALGGLAGATIVAASGGSMGLLGSLFMPNSLIGGAMVGMGTMLLTQTEKFKEVMFGKEENGERQGGLISKEQGKAFKKALPIIVGGATLGALKSMVGFGGLPGPLGVVTGALLPGGILGGALLGTATSLIVRNEKFQKLAFGEKDDDGKRTGGKLSNFMNKGSAVIQKSLNFITGAGKGLLIGGLTAKVIGEMGILGAALTPFGPLGGALIGAGIGIAAQTERFKKMLFGEKDEESGKRKGGLLTKFANMVNINLLEPGKLWFKDMVAETGYAIHDHIIAPIKDIFKPIGNTINEIKTSIEDAVHSAFEKIADKVTDTFEKLVAPIGRFFVNWILKPIGKAAGATVKTGVKLTAGIVGAPLKAVASVMNFKRSKNHLKNKWAERNGSGPLEYLRRGFDILNLANPFNNTKSEEEIEYDKAKEEERAERRNERKLLKARQKWQREDKYSENTNMSEKEYMLRRKRLLRLGISENDIQSQQDLNDFIYRNKLRSKTSEDIKRSQQEIEKDKQETTDYRNGVQTRLDRISKQLGEMLGSDRPGDSAFEASFRGRNDLTPREQENISNMAEAVSLGMNKTTTEIQEKEHKASILNFTQGLSFKHGDEEADTDEATITQLEDSDEEEITKKESIFKKILNFGGVILSGIGNAIGSLVGFIKDHPLLSGGIATTIGAGIYTSLKESGIWDEYISPFLDNLKDVVSEGIANGWELINPYSGTRKSNNEAKRFEDEEVYAQQTLVNPNGVLNNYAFNYLATNPSKKTYFAGAEKNIRNEMKNLGYSTEQTNRYIEKLKNIQAKLKDQGAYLSVPAKISKGYSWADINKSIDSYVHSSGYFIDEEPEGNQDSSLMPNLGKNRKIVSSIGKGKMQHFSQNDTKWRSQTIGMNSDGSRATLSSGGCGMTSLAMVANSLGKRVTPSDVANLAVSNGYVSDGGSNENLFTQGSAQLGLSSKQLSNKLSIIKSLQQNKRLILAGRTSLDDGIYSPEGHIITASGMDSRGNVTIDDPENKKSTIVPIRSLLKGVTHAWSFNRGTSAGVKLGKGSNKLVGKSSRSILFTENRTTKIFEDGARKVAEDVYKNKSKLKEKKYVNKLSDDVVKSLYQAHPELIQQYPEFKQKVIKVLGNDILTTKTVQNVRDSYVTRSKSKLGGVYDGSFTLSDGTVVQVRNGAIYYNQNDTKWAGTPLGSSTVGDIGCVASSMGMAIASLLGEDVNPGIVVSRWKDGFSGGSINWDKFLSLVKSDTGVQGRTVSGSDEAIRLLRNDVPVVLFGKRNNGVYGPSGGSTHAVLGVKATDSGVIVNDPGWEGRCKTIFPLESLKSGYKRGVAFTDINGNGLDGSGFNASNFNTSMYSNSYSYGEQQQSGGFLSNAVSGVASWLSPIFTPLMQLAGVMKNKILSLLTGEDYQSVFDESGNYIGASDTGLFGTIGNMITGGGYNGTIPLDSTASAYIDGKWDQNALLHQDLKMYGPETITAEELNGWTQHTHPGTWWGDKGRIVMEAARRTGYDPRYIMSHAIHETGWNPSAIAQKKYNYFGIGAFDASPMTSAHSWSGVEAGIIGGAEWINKNYYERSSNPQRTLYRMRFNNGEHEYATDSGWASKIASIWSKAPAPHTNTKKTVTYKDGESRTFYEDSLTGELIPELKSRPGHGKSLSIGKGKKEIDNSPKMEKNYNSLTKLFARTSNMFGINDTSIGKGSNGRTSLSTAERLMKSIKPKQKSAIQNFNVSSIGQGRSVGRGMSTKYADMEKKLQLSLKTDSLEGRVDTLTQVASSILQYLKHKEDAPSNNTTINYNNTVVGKGSGKSKPIIINNNSSNSNGNTTLRQQHDLITRGIRM